MSTNQPTPTPGPARFARRLAAFALAAGLAVLASTCVLFVDETEFVTVERFGRIVAVYDQPTDRGLHGKLPWPFEVARRFDARVQLFDPPAREVFTRDKKNITVDAYVCWKIASAAEGSDPLERPVVRFFRSLGSSEVAEARLDSRVRSTLSTQIGQIELSSLLQVEDSEAGPLAAPAGLLSAISDRVKDHVIQEADEPDSLAARLGIEVVDVRIKRISFPAGNQQAVFERMKSERRKIADRYRSAGLAENTMIKSQADRQYNELLARAEADAERIRGQAEAEAVNILNRAHARDPEFYRTMRTLDAYREILNERTTLVLSASSNLLKLLTEGIPALDGSEATPSPSTTADMQTAGRRSLTPATQSASVPDAAEPAPADDETSEAPNAKAADETTAAADGGEAASP